MQYDIQVSWYTCFVIGSLFFTRVLENMLTVIHIHIPLNSKYISAYTHIQSDQKVMQPFPDTRSFRQNYTEIRLKTSTGNVHHIQ